ncbi:MAG: hypothetical protein NTZ65_00125 [Candidatus Berkelbacteria bacterium]|nr:hypothetical protein [Candidatus Berkelbacteria bacterium]
MKEVNPALLVVCLVVIAGITIAAVMSQPAWIPPGTTLDFGVLYVVGQTSFVVSEEGQIEEKPVYPPPSRLRLGNGDYRVAVHGNTVATIDVHEKTFIIRPAD